MTTSNLVVNDYIKGARYVASLKVLEKAGFKKEGVLRNFEFIRGKYVESCLYSIIEEEERALDNVRIM